MAIYGNLRDYKFQEDVDDIRGADVYGINDKKLGEIDDVIFDSNSGELKYIVVDTGGWLSSQRFIVPALQLTILEEGDEDYYLNLTQEQIERFPEYKEEKLASDEEWTDYERQYEKSIDDGPVMHVKGSTRMVTPEPSQVEGAGTVGGSPIDHAAATPRRIGHDRPLFGATSTADSTDKEAGSLIARTVSQPDSPLASSTKDIPDERRFPSRGRRFESFEERLRREREEILRRQRAA